MRLHRRPGGLDLQAGLEVRPSLRAKAGWVIYIDESILDRRLMDPRMRFIVCAVLEECCRNVRLTVEQAPWQQVHRHDLSLIHI